MPSGDILHNNRHESNKNGEKMSTRSIVNLFKMYCRSCGLFRVLRTKNVSRMNKKYSTYFPFIDFN